MSSKDIPSSDSPSPNFPDSPHFPDLRVSPSPTPSPTRVYGPPQIPPPRTGSSLSMVPPRRPSLSQTVSYPYSYGAASQEDLSASRRYREYAPSPDLREPGPSGSGSYLSPPYLGTRTRKRSTSLKYPREREREEREREREYEYGDLTDKSPVVLQSGRRPLWVGPRTRKAFEAAGLFEQPQRGLTTPRRDLSYGLPLTASRERERGREFERERERERRIDQGMGIERSYSALANRSDYAFEGLPYADEIAARRSLDYHYLEQERERERERVWGARPSSARDFSGAGRMISRYLDRSASPALGGPAGVNGSGNDTLTSSRSNRTLRPESSMSNIFSRRRPDLSSSVSVSGATSVTGRERERETRLLTSFSRRLGLERDRSESDFSPLSNFSRGESPTSTVSISGTTANSYSSSARAPSRASMVKKTHMARSASVSVSTISALSGVSGASTVSAASASGSVAAPAGTGTTRAKLGLTTSDLSAHPTDSSLGTSTPGAYSEVEVEAQKRVREMEGEMKTMKEKHATELAAVLGALADCQETVRELKGKIVELEIKAAVRSSSSSSSHPAFASPVGASTATVTGVAGSASTTPVQGPKTKQKPKPKTKSKKAKPAPLAISDASSSLTPTPASKPLLHSPIPLPSPSVSVTITAPPQPSPLRNHSRKPSATSSIFQPVPDDVSLLLHEKASMGSFGGYMDGEGEGEGGDGEDEEGSDEEEDGGEDGEFEMENVIGNDTFDLSADGEGNRSGSSSRPPSPTLVLSLFGPRSGQGQSQPLMVPPSPLTSSSHPTPTHPHGHKLPHSSLLDLSVPPSPRSPRSARSKDDYRRHHRHHEANSSISTTGSALSEWEMQEGNSLKLRPEHAMFLDDCLDSSIDV
jgi:hypothetical protein